MALLSSRAASMAAVAPLGAFLIAALTDVALGHVPAHLVLYAAITWFLRDVARGAASGVRS